MKAQVALLALAVISLGACREAPQESALVRDVMFTASGSFDAQADTRDRVGGGLRRVQWVTRPPLTARQVTVLYDSDARPLAWQLDALDPTFSAEELAGPGAARVQTPQGPGWRPAPDSRLGDVLILRVDGGLRLLTRGYAAQRTPALLNAYRR